MDAQTTQSQASARNTWNNIYNTDRKPAWLVIDTFDDGIYLKRLRDCEKTPDVLIKFQNTMWEFFLQPLKDSVGASRWGVAGLKVDPVSIAIIFLPRNIADYQPTFQ